MKTVIELAKQVSDEGYAPVLLHPEVRRLCELVRADERNSWPAEMEAMERQVNILTDALTFQSDHCVDDTKEGES